MSEPANVPNALDDVLERLSHASSQIVKAVEDQTAPHRPVDEGLRRSQRGRDRTSAEALRAAVRAPRSTRSDARSRSSNVEPVRSGRRHR